MRWLSMSLANKYLSWLNSLHVLAAFLVEITLAVYFEARLLNYSSELRNMLQICEPYVYITSDPKMFGAVMLGGVLLLSDAPFLTPLSQYEMLRIGKKKWVGSQICYVFLTSFLYFIILLFSTAVVGSFGCGVYFIGGWSDTMEILSFTNPSAAATNFQLGFNAPEMLQAVSPVVAALEGIFFQSLYLGMIGLSILCVNMNTRQNYGWIVGSVLHFMGYLIYANSGFGMQAKYSLLCCVIPRFHYIPSMGMPGIYCSFLLFTLIWIVIQVCNRTAHRIEPFL